MDWTSLVLLGGAGLVGGFIAGLIGVGGGIVFAPVLFFYFQSAGVAADVVTPLTLGSSLLCTLVASLASGTFHYRARAVDVRVALAVGLFSAVAVQLTTGFVTTRPWYDGTAFQVVFGLILLVVTARMAQTAWAGKRRVGRTSGEVGRTSGEAPARRRWPWLAGIGTVAGAVSSAAGVGGGVVLVPAYAGLLRLPMHRAAGTSSATIVLIALAGVVSYAATGWGAPTSGLAVGYVDVGRALVLAVPAVGAARLGVMAAHRLNTRALRIAFAALAASVAVRLLWEALG